MPKREYSHADYFLPPGPMMGLVVAFYLGDDDAIRTSPLAEYYIPFLFERGFIDRDGLTEDGQQWVFRAMWCGKERRDEFVRKTMRATT